MIVDPDQPGSPVDERSPLKGPTSGPPPQPENQGPSYSAPPPPYAPSQPTYQSGIPPYPIPVQHGQPTFRPAHGEPRGEPALQRIAKAYIIALLILFLWGIFVDSVDMLSSHHGKRRPYLDSVKSSWWEATDD